MIALLLVGTVAGYWSEHNLRAQRLNETRIQARMLGASIAPAIEFEDRSAIRSAIYALRADPNIKHVVLYDAYGQLAYGYARPGSHLAGLMDGDSNLATLEQDHIFVRQPINSHGSNLGTLEVRADFDPINRRLVQNVGLALLFGMGMIVILVLELANTAMRGVNEDLARSNARLRNAGLERARAEEALRQAQKMQAVGQLVGGIAHDFNNLLTPLTGGLEIIAQNLKDPRLQRLAQNALDAARKGTRLTGQLLAFSRVQKIQMKAVDIAQLVRGMKILLTQAVGAKVDLEMDLQDNAGLVLCDANQVENALLNLAINARDAMPDGGVLRIALRAADQPDMVEILVEDTGTGMSAETLARATEPFFTTKPIGKGTGLGLSQVYGIIEQCGGQMEIDSMLGRGTCVSIRLRRAQEKLPSENIKIEDGAQYCPLPCTKLAAHILIIDDDEKVRLFMAATLEAHGHHVDAAADGQTALEMLQAQSYDLLIVDYAMPGMTGSELVSAARKTHPDQTILFVTGYADTAALHQASGGEANILHKPFGSQELIRAVDALLQHYVSHVDQFKAS